MRLVTKNSQETKKFARKLVGKIISDSYSSSEARSLKRIGSRPPRADSNNNVLCLYGDLGAGKTTFTQGLAEYFGISRIISPTFVLIRQYPLTNFKFQISNFKLTTLYHIDLYRLGNIEEIKNLGIEEIMADKNNVVVIEWADKLKKLLPKNRTDIYFKYISDEEREIIINFSSGSSFRA
ncbi:MAG: tRNA (adenosine(37)-N6)-threonylcarbamoyltransferase complex ATPase subunit type 1 TsaE [Patescibacteria group bacterium]|nr:tRNA (adenosine(37)-N6)-threonylcarbamoyltransferase complex ATPase subunit type 1 TsaE [Patescibacteria group bacterium]